MVELTCKPHSCPAGKIKVASARNPPGIDPPTGYNQHEHSISAGFNCTAIPIDPGFDPEFSYCCDPPSKYGKMWPVDPKELFSNYFDDVDNSDVLWKYTDDYEDNDAEPFRSTEEDGKNAYGFVLLDGPEGSLDSEFAQTQTFIRQSQDASLKRKRDLLTTNRTLLDTVFEHSEETFFVYCNYPPESKQCQKVFIDGVVDTIISLPPHVGEGPFARIISMELADPVLKLPVHHLKHRSSEGIEENSVYRLKIDYNFHDIQPKGDNKEPVMIRVDFTNLLGYWDEMTAAPEDSSARVKRGISNDSLTVDEWRTRVQRASRKEANLQKGQANVNINSSMDLTNSSTSFPQKRWCGPFSDWLKRLTTVTKSSVGVLELGLAKTINLFRYTAGCQSGHLFAEVKVDLQANMALDAKYAYYLSATFVPPSKPEVFAYLGMEPTAYLGLHIEGNAQMQTWTERKKIIDTLTYPGLAVKGIAAIGPTLDVYGEIRGSITLSGSLDAGASLKFGKAEVYWPEHNDAKDKYETLLGLNSEATAPSGRNIEPVLKAGVAVDAALDVIITPEAHIGIKIGGGTLVGGATLMDAQLSGFVEADLNFRAHADLSSSDQAFHYSLGSYIIYNLGYKATAKILGIVDWVTGDRRAWNPSRELTLYEKSGAIPLVSSAEDRDDLITLFDNITNSAEQDIYFGALQDIWNCNYLWSRRVTGPSGEKYRLDGEFAQEIYGLTTDDWEEIIG
ncbi:hypothetical protein N7528_000038 [Penicillium herquei]|nr:hypothetical protein N7528_000038 [Penicillium herquei]